jgi:hypothetical protein
LTIPGVTVVGPAAVTPDVTALVVTIPGVSAFGGSTLATWQEGGLLVVIQAGGAAAASQNSGGLQMGHQG